MSRRLVNLLSTTSMPPEQEPAEWRSAALHQ
jgi:hypothetical protein